MAPAHIYRTSYSQNFCFSNVTFISFLAIYKVIYNLLADLSSAILLLFSLHFSLRDVCLVNEIFRKLYLLPAGCRRESDGRSWAAEADRLDLEVPLAADSFGVCGHLVVETSPLVAFGDQVDGASQLVPARLHCRSIAADLRHVRVEHHGNGAHHCWCRTRRIGVVTDS